MRTTDYPPPMAETPARSDNQALFHVKSEELAALFRERATYHTKRAEAWDAEVENYVPPRQTGYHQGMLAQMAQVGYQPPDQRPDMRERAEHHRSEARRFTFRAEHVLPQRTFVLSNRDLFDMQVPE